MTFHNLPGSLPLLTSLRTLPPHSARRGRPGCFNNLGPGATPSHELSPPFGVSAGRMLASERRPGQGRYGRFRASLVFVAKPMLPQKNGSL